MMTVVVPLSAFFRFNAELCFSSAMALNSLRDRLCLGFVVLIPANSVLKIRKKFRLSLW